jgi:hypothetical protein
MNTDESNNPLKRKPFVNGAVWQLLLIGCLQLSKSANVLQE